MSLALIPRTIAIEIAATPAQVGAAITLLDEGATVPFIARYRKEVTGVWMTRNCALWPTGWSICESWRRGARRLPGRSASRAR